VVIERGYKDECLSNNPQIEAFIFIVDQEQAFKARFQMKVNCGRSKVKLSGSSK
jgi:hypothetical protein